MKTAPPDRRSMMFTNLSRLVLAIIIALVLVFAYHAGIFSAIFFRKDEPVVDLPRPEQVSSGKSSITGFDKDEQPYRFTAQSAIQDVKDSDLVHLDTVDGEFRKKDGETLELSAKQGQYRTETKVLDLQGDIRLESKGRYKASMEKATVTLKDRRWRSDVPVTVLFDRGRIDAKGVEITDNGKRVVFFGRVKTTIYPADEKTGNKGNKQQ